PTPELHRPAPTGETAHPEHSPEPAEPRRPEPPDDVYPSGGTDGGAAERPADSHVTPDQVNHQGPDPAPHLPRPTHTPAHPDSHATWSPLGGADEGWRYRASQPRGPIAVELRRRLAELFHRINDSDRQWGGRPPLDAGWMTELPTV